MKTVNWLLLLIPTLAVCCSPSTVITASWKSTTAKSQPYSRIIVAALKSNTIAKETVENDIATILGTSTEILKSISEFPPDISNSDTDKVAIMNKVKNKNIDAILTISLVNKETDTRYIPGRAPYNPVNGYPYYDNFWGYYSYWYPNTFNQGYYIEDKVYFIETNLYDVKTEKLIWSAQSKTYNPLDLKTFSKEYSTLIAKKLKQDGLIKHPDK